jgi:transposase
MGLSEFDLQQIDRVRLQALSAEQKDALILKLVRELQDALDRLKQNPHNSSRPPSSAPPWAGDSGENPEAERGESSRAEPEPFAPPVLDGAATESTHPQGESKEHPKEKRKAGRQQGAAGHSRSVVLPFTGEQCHYPTQCEGCGEVLDAKGFVARAGVYVLDVEVGAQGLLGLQVTHEKHLYGELVCACGQVNRSAPGRCAPEAEWQVELTEWHIVGPLLTALIVCLSHRMLVSRVRIQEFLHDWLGLYLSTSTLNQCIHEAGRAVAPVEEQLVAELQDAYQAHADETPWKEWGKLVWLWVMTTPTVCLYLVGSRGREIIEQVFGEAFPGWLMTDGYQVYRKYKNRLRCWAHLLRKARGLAESMNLPDAQPFGTQVLALLQELMHAVYQAREGAFVDLTILSAKRLADFKTLCEQSRDSPHKKTRELAREFLNDWEAIWVVLKYPWLPLTNNEAERALRHWVIARRMSSGTRTPQGSRAFALLASVIETCRKRHLAPWPYLAHVIAERRRGNPAPLLPASCPA